MARGGALIGGVSVLLMGGACSTFATVSPAPAPTADGGTPAPPADAGGPQGPQRCTKGTFGAPTLFEAMSPNVEARAMWLSPDETRLYLAGAVVSGTDSDLFLASRPGPDASFGEAERGGVLAALNLGAVQMTRLALSSDERTIVVQYEEAGKRTLRTTTRATTTDVFGETALVAFKNLNGDVVDGSGLGEDPHFTRDGLSLYFVRRDETATRRIHVSTSSPSGTGTRWAPPEALDLGSPGGVDEVMPVVTSDGSTLFFAEARGLDKLDIYVRDRLPTAKFTGPVSILEGVNSSEDDYPVAVSEDGCVLYFLSRRGDGKPRIWQTARTK